MHIKPYANSGKNNIIMTIIIKCANVLLKEKNANKLEFQL